MVVFLVMYWDRFGLELVVVSLNRVWLIVFIVVLGVVGMGIVWCSVFLNVCFRVCCVVSSVGFYFSLGFSLGSDL